MPSRRRARNGEEAAKARGRARHAADALRKGETAVASHLTPLKKVPWWNVLTALVTLVAAAFMLSAVAALPSAFSEVTAESWAWIIPAVVTAGLVYLGYAVALAGSVVTPVSIVIGSQVMLGESFTNMATPAGVGSFALTTRFLQLQGVDLASAASSASLSAVGASVVQGVAVVIFGALSAGSFSGKELTQNSGGHWWVLVLVIVGAAVVTVVLRVPRLRGRVIPPLVRAARNLLAVLRQPKKGAQLLGGEAFAVLLQALCLGSCLLMVDASTSFSVLIVLTVLALGAQYAVPVPGALGAPEAVLVAGLTAAGVSRSPAVAAAASYRMLVYWLPAIPGWVILRSLKNRHAL